MKMGHLLMGVAFTANLPATTAQEVKKTYLVSKSGILVSMMMEEEASQVVHLILAGRINAVDFRHLRDESENLRVLDIANASINMYSGKEDAYPDGFYVYTPNFVPAYALCKMENDIAKGKLTLKKAILLEKIKDTEDVAFMGCKNLNVCQTKRKTPPNLLPGTLADSITAIFVPPGASGKCRLRSHWDNFAFVEGKPLEAKIGVDVLSILESEIQKAGLQPKEINFLTVEGKPNVAGFKLMRDYMPNPVAVDIEKTNTTAIPDSTFSQREYLLCVRLPHGLKSIGQQAFDNCRRLRGAMELPEGITTIEHGAFMGCDRLRYVVTKGGKITTVGDNLFGEGKNKSIYKR